MIAIILQLSLNTMTCEVNMTMKYANEIRNIGYAERFEKNNTVISCVNFKARK